MPSGCLFQEYRRRGNYVGKDVAKSKEELLDELVHAAMRIAMFDNDYTNMDIPEVKHNHDYFKEEFSKILKIELK